MRDPLSVVLSKSLSTAVAWIFAILSTVLQWRRLCEECEEQRRRFKAESAALATVLGAGTAAAWFL